MDYRRDMDMKEMPYDLQLCARGLRATEYAAEPGGATCGWTT